MPTNTSTLSDAWSRWALPLFLVLGVLVRWGTFGPSVINHDESTYIVIAEGLLGGQTYLVDTFDTKPIGIFWIYAAMSWLGGSSIFMFRLFTALVVGGTAYLLFRVSRQATGQASVAWAAGVMYLLLSSVFKYYGLSPNTELFFVPFAVAAISLVWSGKTGLWRYILAGFLLGCGFMVKYVIAADALAIGLLLLWRINSKREPWLEVVFKRCAPLTIAFFIPFAAVYGYYAQMGQLDSFLFYTFEVTSRYPVEATALKRLLFSLEFFGRFFPVTGLAIFAFRDVLAKDRSWQLFLLLWLCVNTIMTLLPGKTFGHYQIQLMPPLAALAATFFHPERTIFPWFRRQFSTLTSVGTISVLAILLLVLPISLFVYYSGKADTPRKVAAQIKEHLAPGDTFYTGNYHHIIYHLLGQHSPTPYVHSSLLFYDHHVEALDIDLAEEGQGMFANKRRPQVVLLRLGTPITPLTGIVEQYYSPNDTLFNEVVLWTPKKTINDGSQ